MPAPYLKQQIQNIPLKVVGSNKFGRYPKISNEQTWNMIVSDGALVPYAGYAVACNIGSTAEGRGIYATTVGNFILAVIGSVVYRLTSSLTLYALGGIGTLATNSGDVYMAENNNAEILITDGVYAYVYDFGNSVFYSSAPGATNVLTFPYDASGYCSYQNGRFIVAINGTQQWVLSEVNQGTSWPNTAAFNGTIQGKPGYVQAAVPMPGGGNNILIFGSNGAESWQDVALALFPYQRNSTFNIDYGCINAASIAELENFVVWLAVNEQSGPVIMYTQGSGIKTVSTDGINFKLSQLTNPSNCTGFLFKQDGHLIYQFTFPDDNLSYAYDFNTDMFFTVTDEDLNYHIARQVVNFNNDYYFVSLNGGNVFRFGTQYTDVSYEDGVEHILPRLRVTPPLRLPSQRYFIIKSLGFTIENGEINTKTRVEIQDGFIGTDITTESSVLLTTEGGIDITTESDASATEIVYLSSAAVYLSISRDGAESFGSSLRLDMNDTGYRKSRFIYQRLGIANDASFQLRFSGFKRFVAFDGEVEIWQ